MAVVADRCCDLSFESLPKDIVQKGLLVVTTACAALSIIPQFRLAGSLATRSVALLTSTSLCASEGQFTIANCAKLGAVTLGLIGVAASSPVLIIASLTADLAIQIMNTIKAFREGNTFKGWTHIGITVVNALTLAAVASGAWQVIVTAAAVNAVVMFALSLRAGRNGDITGNLCYAALTVLSVWGAIGAAEHSRHTATHAHFTLRNRKDHVITLYGRRDIVVGQLNPGETKEIVVPVENCGRSWIFGGPNSWFGDSFIRSSPTSRHGIEADSYTYDTQILHPAIPAREFPTLPMTGTAIVTQDLDSR